MNRNAPEEIVYHKIGHTLEIAWPDARFDLPAELLRVYSPSAEVRGHSEQERVLQTGKKNVGIKAIEAIGNYAIRITFDDGHDSGIYAWDYLYELGNNQAKHWQDYLSELKQANASRLPTIPVGQWQPNNS
ncbi:MAG TPA: 1-(5-phosphoribosyl)-5-((5-phosphoribosylamino)methylideneamino)imidazole-4-carboxamide isomerase [Gammaproteobacteria bacterium]|nr:1-(5-phosphoribosyl)-5-((5-phosphoribosylamino)methylideneamino)imidazole-4-carboxamide isomerase [Gammaproteobacteria bacterium]HBF63122.1 1-(5-phosphoribosyl)-5-((5-phosphoribosylamino)methylideneamino)imidazole-4-carboxamide isomerase [Gammaproteobacteria bacterium]HBK11696.1 1-(5-phosphoribosyl)-5-((5-phosphoribosylamino)methylideneamino)imidazole-4-carboxamide isomerase [Gammaproteobacteria bacterium]|tara:strand:+ start:1423 stop:1815 length:393 start_codon:yes stop_codon:yes gene_type:complete